MRLSSSSVRAARCAVSSRVPLLIESLEERALLSASRGHSAWVDFASLRAVPGAYSDSSILVRFRPNTPARAAASVLPGTILGAESGFVPGLRSVQLNGVGVGVALAAYQASPWVLYAEPNYTLRPAATVPNDPRFPEQWALENTGQGGGSPDAHIKATLAWDCCTGSLRQVVAVIDTGIDYDHEDLYLNVWINSREIPESRRGNLFDLDGDGIITFWDLNHPLNQGPYQITDVNGDGRISASDLLEPMAVDNFGYDLGFGGWVNGISEYGGERADDLVGWNFALDNNVPLDLDGHGTHVAGIIGAIGSNALGIAGVNWRVQLMALKIGGAAELNLDAAVSAIAYAVANGAGVSNHSYASGDVPRALYDAMAAASDAGHIIVAAAGNDGSDNDLAPVYPAGFNLSHLLAVTATNHSDGRPAFANFGLTTVHLGAPGVDILSTTRGGGYATRSGTSMAAAHVTGAVALLREMFPQMSAREIIDQILSGAEPVEALSGMTITGGRLSLASACGGIERDPGVDESNGSDESPTVEAILASLILQEETDAAWAETESVPYVAAETEPELPRMNGPATTSNLEAPAAQEEEGMPTLPLWDEGLAWPPWA